MSVRDMFIFAMGGGAGVMSITPATYLAPLDRSEWYVPLACGAIMCGSALLALWITTRRR